MMKNLMAAAAIVALSAAPAMAAPVANPAASLSLANSARAGTVTAKKSGLAGTGLIVAGIAAVAVIVGIIIIADNGNSDSK